ncbi:MAG: CPBP family intramembrane glutamic endopeptidase [Polyangiaceae bacterium]
MTVSVSSACNALGSLPELLLLAGPRQSLGLPGIDGVLGATLKMLVPALGFLVMAPVLWIFFRETWRRLDDEATEYRRVRRLTGGFDARPVVVFALAAVVLTAQEYYGGSRFFHGYIRPLLKEIVAAQGTAPGGFGQYVDLKTYGALYSYGWWAFTRVVGYTVVPIGIYRLFFRRDKVLDMGLRTKGFFSHLWIYGLCLLVVVPAVVLVAQSPEFSTYYPFYKNCSRSWADLIVWEMLYLVQFFALEVFFRGFMLSPLRRSLGSGAIFAMCVPYVMIHYGKPYLEAGGALIAGVALGSLAMRTRSVYAGFMVHATVALLMDGLAITAGGGFPTRMWP